MTDETPPPAPGMRDDTPPAEPSRMPATIVPGIGTLGLTLLGGALAAAVGVMVVRPLLKRRTAKPASRRAGRPRTPRKPPEG